MYCNKCGNELVGGVCPFCSADSLEIGNVNEATPNYFNQPNEYQNNTNYTENSWDYEAYAVNSNDKRCPNCSTIITDRFCPNCGYDTAGGAGFVYVNDSVGANDYVQGTDFPHGNDSAFNKSDKKKKDKSDDKRSGMVWAIALGIIILICVAIGGICIFVPGFFTNKMPKEETVATEECGVVFYENNDGEVCALNVTTFDEAELNGDCYSAVVSDDGSVVYYLTASGILYKHDMEKDNSEKIASNVTKTVKMAVSSNGKYVFYASQNNLYVHDGKDVRKIDVLASADNAELLCSHDGSYIMAETDGRIYVTETKTEGYVVLEGNNKLLAVTKDGAFYYQDEEGGVYRWNTSNKSKEKMADSVDFVFNVEENGTVYYLKTEKETISLGDIVVNNIVGGGSPGEKPMRTNYENDYEYYAALHTYNRGNAGSSGSFYNSIKSLSAERNIARLCCKKANGEEVEIKRGFVPGGAILGDITYGVPYCIMANADNENLKVKLSQLSAYTSDAVIAEYDMAVTNYASRVFVASGKAFTVSADENIVYSCYNKANNKVYYLTTEGVLKTISADGLNNDVAYDVEQFELNSKGDVVYLTNNGSLMLNDDKIDDNAREIQYAGKSIIYNTANLVKKYTKKESEQISKLNGDIEYISANKNRILLGEFYAEYQNSDGSDAETNIVTISDTAIITGTKSIGAIASMQFKSSINMLSDYGFTTKIKDNNSKTKTTDRSNALQEFADSGVSTFIYAVDTYTTADILNLATIAKDNGKQIVFIAKANGANEVESIFNSTTYKLKYQVVYTNNSFATQQEIQMFSWLLEDAVASGEHIIIEVAQSSANIQPDFVTNTISGRILPLVDKKYYTQQEIIIAIQPWLNAGYSSAQALRFARNEIYANHGSTFNDVELRKYFYVERSAIFGTAGYLSADVVYGMFNAYEIKNIKTLKEMEGLYNR